MRNVTLIILAVGGLAVGNAVAAYNFFQEVIGPPYEWVDDNFSIGWVPNSDDKAKFDGGVNGEVNGQLAVVRDLDIQGGSSVTLNSGRIDVMATEDYWDAVEIGTASGGTTGTLNVNGGVLEVPHVSNWHGNVFIGRWDSVGYLNQTGGTINILGTNPDNGNTDSTITISMRGASAKSFYNMSGGTVNTHQMLVAHGSATGGAELHISGDAVINLSGTRYHSGFMLNTGAVVSVTGGDASINVTGGGRFGFGGWANSPGPHTLIYNIDATGASTISAEYLGAELNDKDGNPQQNILELNAVRGITGGTYTLMHFVRDPTAKLPLLTQTGDPNFTNLRVEENMTSGGWELLVDYYRHPPYCFDIDLGGFIDDDDLSLLLANWGYGTTWGEGDLTGDGTVDDDDLSLLLANWGACSSTAPEGIPEPTTLVLLAVGAILALRQRHSRAGGRA